MPKVAQPTEIHQQLMEKLTSVIGLPKFRNIPPEEVLAVVSQLLGQLVFHLDPVQYSGEQVMQAIRANIVTGNESMLEAMTSPSVVN